MFCFYVTIFLFQLIYTFWNSNLGYLLLRKVCLKSFLKHVGYNLSLSLSLSHTHTHTRIMGWILVFILFKKSVSLNTWFSLVVAFQNRVSSRKDEKDDLQSKHWIGSLWMGWNQTTGFSGSKLKMKIKLDVEKGCSFQFWKPEGGKYTSTVVCFVMQCAFVISWAIIKSNIIQGYLPYSVLFNLTEKQWFKFCLPANKRYNLLKHYGLILGND